MKTHWEERYAAKEYAYGTTPNSFFKEQIDKLQPSKILLPAEGEGRNAVYAATQGWQVTAFDQSLEGKKKALQLAEISNTTIQYDIIEEPSEITYQEEEFNVIALIYAHFDPKNRLGFHSKFNKLLKRNGLIIFEAFSKNHLPYNTKNPSVGGPKSLDLLFSIEEIKKEFKELEFIYLEEIEIELKEGLFHNGLGNVVRFIAKKY